MGRNGSVTGARNQSIDLGVDFLVPFRVGVARRGPALLSFASEIRRLSHALASSSLRQIARRRAAADIDDRGTSDGIRRRTLVSMDSISKRSVPLRSTNGGRLSVAQHCSIHCLSFPALIFRPTYSRTCAKARELVIGRRSKTRPSVLKLALRRDATSQLTYLRRVAPWPID